MESIWIDWALRVIIALVGSLGGLIWWVFRRLDSRVEQLTTLHTTCQKDLYDKFINRTDFGNFLTIRAGDHQTINQRLHTLENQQSQLLTKIDLFMDDTSSKLKRLSETFVVRAAEISRRIDNLVVNNQTREGGS